MGNLARDVLFRMPARDVIQYSRSPALTNLMHGQVPATMTNPIEYMYPLTWLRPNIDLQAAAQLIVRELCTLTHAEAILNSVR